MSPSLMTLSYRAYRATRVQASRFIAGNSDDAKRKVSGILKDFGWGVMDVGGIESFRYLEALCMGWVLSAIRTNNWNQAFKLLRK